MFFFFPVRDEYGIKKLPFIVISIITINCFVYFLNAYFPDYKEIVLKFGFIPARPSFLTIITSMFLHGGIFHLGFNMWYLWLFGDNIEDRWGSLNFLLFYLSAGVFATLLYSIMVPSQFKNIPLIGASGAIAGVLGAYAVLFPKSRITFKYFFWFLIFIKFGEFELFAYVWLSFWFLSQGISTLLVAKQIAVSSVAFAAHFAGFIYGMIIGIGTRAYREAKYRENVSLGKNLLLNLLGEKQKIIRTFEEECEISRMKEEIMKNFEGNKNLAVLTYSQLIKKYPEVVLPEKIQYEIAESLEKEGKKEDALIAYKNFILNYPFSKLADNALLSLGKIFIEKEEYEKAKQAFFQIILFYPYSDTYEEAKYYLEKKLPSLFPKYQI